jgi:actin-related protein
VNYFTFTSPQEKSLCTRLYAEFFELSVQQYYKGPFHLALQFHEVLQGNDMINSFLEIDKRFYCPVAGYCLNPAEQKQVLKKCRFRLSGLTEHQLHALIIEAMEEDEQGAARIARILDQKYRNEIEEWRDYTPGQWLDYVKKNLNHQNFGAVIWITAAWLRLPQDISDRIYGMLHMFPHNQIQQQESILAHAAQAKSQQRSIQDNFLTTRKELIELQKKQKRILRTLEEQRKLAEKYRIKLSQPAATEKLVQMQDDQNRIETLRKKLSVSKEARNAVREERDQLKEELLQQATMINSLSSDLAQILAQSQVKECLNEECPSYDLCSRRILIVGGMSKLRSFYEKLVSDLGGLFEYHDGRIKNSEDLLSYQISRSDYVLCPVDVNSHAACLRVKRYSKKTNTPYFMLPNSSVSSIYGKLRELAQVSMN